MIKGKKIKNQNITTIINVLSTVILQGLAFFSSPYFSQVLGVESFGIVSVYVTWVQVVAIVFGLRINGALIMGQNEYSDKEQPEFQSSVLFLAIISFFAFSIITFLINFLVLHKSTLMLLMICMHGFGQFMIFFANSKFTNEFRADFNFYLSLFISISTIALSAVLITYSDSELNYWGRIFGEAIPYFCVGVLIASVFLFRGKKFYNRKYWRFCIPLVIPMIFHGLAGIILNQSDRIMLDILTSSATVGIYSLAYTFSNVIFVCWSALNNSWVPFYYEYMRNGDLDTINKKAQNYMELFSVLCCGFVLLAPEVYYLFAGDEFWNGVKMIPIFTVSTFFVFLYSFPINYEIFHKKTKSIANASIISAVVNIILNLILIKEYGAYGAAIATLLCYLLQLLLHHMKAFSISKEKMDYTFKLQGFIPYVVIVCLTSTLVMLNITIGIRWFIALIIGVYELLRIVKRKGIF